MQHLAEDGPWTAATGDQLAGRSTASPSVAMTRVSSGTKKSGPPCHQNQFAFVHNPASRLTKIITAIPLGEVCARCREVLEWRKKFRKYKPLKEPRRCARCGGKTVKDAYHTVCRDCAEREAVCGKCLQPRDGSAKSGNGLSPADKDARRSDDQLENDENDKDSDGQDDDGADRDSVSDADADADDDDDDNSSHDEQDD